MHEQDASLPDALGARGADVILLQDFQHGGTGDAGNQRDIHATERDGGQDQVLKPGPEALGDWRIALHWQPIELERKHIGEQVTHDENRHREAEHRKRHDGAIDQGIRSPCRYYADRYGDADGKRQGHRHQRQRRLRALRDQRGDREVGEDRRAEIAVKDLPEPFTEPDQKRPVEPEAHADARDVVRGSLVARDHRRRVAGRDVEQAEHEQRHHHHHRDGGHDAPDDVAQHIAMLAGFMPFGRCFRHAKGEPARHRR